MFLPLVALVLAAAPFPLPGVDGKPLAVTEGQKTFRLPTRFDRVKAFYEERFKGVDGVTVRVSGTTGSRLLSLATSRTADAWKSATVREGETETVVELRAVMVMGPVDVAGKGPPVEFILTRSADVKGAIDSIDHTESMRAK